MSTKLFFPLNSTDMMNFYIGQRVDFGLIVKESKYNGTDRD